jgi:hypothetical protein
MWPHIKYIPNYDIDPFFIWAGADWLSRGVKRVPTKDNVERLREVATNAMNLDGTSNVVQMDCSPEVLRLLAEMTIIS